MINFGKKVMEDEIARPASWRAVRLRSGWVWCIVASLVLPALAAAQGMPPEARENIHVLFNGHDQVERKLTLTDHGYVAMTGSTNKAVAAALQQHVEQMKERLDSGLAVRRWDPAFAEYRAHYHDIEISIENTTRGVRVEARGKTPESVKVAQNHAGVINEFVADGWQAHDTRHPAVLRSSADGAGQRMEFSRRGRGNCRRGAGCNRAGCAAAGGSSSLRNR